MQSAPHHPREAERLAVVAQLDALIQAGDPRLDNITAIAAAVCGTPVSVVSLVDFDQQYFVGRTGLEPARTSRDVAFCAHAILQDGLFQVTDATKDPRFADNPLVTGELSIRQYAGVPLESDEGLPFGTLCVIGDTPSALSPHQEHVLSLLAREVTAIVTAHRVVEDLTRAHAAQAGQLARLVHDLQAPLRSMVALTGTLGPTPDPTDLGTLHQAAAQLGRLANAFLDDSGSKVEPSVPLDLRALIEEQVALTRPLVHDSVLLMPVVSPRVPAEVLLPPTTTRRILSNLLSNAAKFTAEGNITVIVDVVDQSIVMAVQDSGTGISPADLDRVFEPRQTAGASPARGAGLGLAIVRERIEALHGTVTLDSIEGRGTKVTARVPLRVPSSPVAEVSPRVLVVDDVAVNRMLAKRLLRAAGFDTETAEDGLEALRIARNRPYDAILVDCWMPGPSGPDVVRRIRDLSGADLLIYGWSGSVDDELRMRFQAAGANGTFGKPLAEEDLSALRRRLAERSVRRSA